MRQKMLVAVVLLLLLSQVVHAQHRVILDTDPSSDPDDVGCMAMLHTMASRGECEILAIINSIDHQEASLSISAINQFYGRSAIPVGDYKAYEHQAASKDLYSYMISQDYPRSLKNHGDAIESVRLYREILASAEAKSITIIVIGTMHNFFALLQSKACEFSQLDGQDLVREKVEVVVTMGGNFIDGRGLDRTNWGGAVELCSYTAWSCLNPERNRMCRFVLENCPAPFVASGWEVGCGDYHNAGRGNVMTGQQLKTLPADHIVRRSYEYHFAKRGGSDKIDRHSNDQCALLYAIRGTGENYQAFLHGDIDLSEEGVCTWTDTKDRQQGYIQKARDPEAIAQEIEELMLGEVVRADSTPARPQQPKVERLDANRLRFSWQVAMDAHPGNWVVAYRVYRGGKLRGTAYGTQFFDTAPPDAEPLCAYTVRAVNASGVESESLEFPMDQHSE